MYQSQRIPITPFDGRNFNTWAFRLKSVLKENDVYEAIADEKYASKSENKKSEARAQALIIAAVSDSHLDYVRKDSAYEMIKTLELNFKAKGVRSKLFLRRNLADLKYNENSSLLEHISKLEAIFIDLKEAESELKEDEKVNYLLLSMPESYEAIVTALETVENLQYDFVKKRLMGEEEKKKKNSSSGQYNISNALLCYTCGKPGHKKFQCREKNQEYNNQGRKTNSTQRRYQRGGGYYGQGQGRDAYQGQGGGAYQGYGRGTHKVQGRGAYQGQARGAHRGQGRFQRQQGSYNQERDHQVFNIDESDIFICEDVLMANSSQQNTDSLVWCVDSGCSDHLVNTKDYFTDYIELKQPKYIAAAKNDVTLQAVGIGNIEVIGYVGRKACPCTIKNVYYVPDLRKNLISVSKINLSGCKVTFTQGKVRIYNRYDNMIMIGNLDGNLYTIKTSINQQNCNYVNKEFNEIANLWHRRFGHLGMHNINRMVKTNIVNGLNDLKNSNIENTLCEPCLLGKMTRQPYNKIGYRAKRPLEIVHTDVCGPITPTSRDGYKYFLTFIDDYTHFVMVYLIKQKSEVFEKFQNYYYYVTNHFNTNLLKLRSDNGGEYVTNDFQKFCAQEGISLQYTVPYNPQMNGVAERMNRTLMEKARTILLDSKLGKEFWADAILYSAYVTNRSPSAGRELTASELWTGRKPDVSNMRVFGCTAYNHVPRELRRKLDNTGKKMIMIGYSTSGYKLFDPETSKLVHARNVIFDERCNGNECAYLPYLDVENKEEGSKEDEEKIYEQEIKEMREGPNNIKTNNNKNMSTKKRNIKINEDIESKEEQEGRGKRNIHKPKWHQEYVMDLDNDSDEVLYALMTSQEDIPSCFEEIEHRKDKQEWKHAIKEEFKVLEESETWEIVPKPENEKLLDSKWVFTRKYIGQKEICKARLVVKGYQQKEQLEGIYSPVLKLQTLRIMLSVAACRDYQIHQMDVKGAFLYGDIKENVYLKPPEGLKLLEGQVLKLTKSLYGLKKSPKYWYEKFNSTITGYGFKRSENDYCLYSMNNTYLLIYVDDILIMSDDIIKINKLKEFLSQRFRMKDMGHDKLLYLGITINRQSNKIVINQTKYLKNVLKKYQMLECKGTATPMDVNFKFDDTELDLSYEQKCRSLTGSLMYAAVGTRPDICNAVCYLSRFQSKPNEALWKALKRILRYVKETLHYALVYYKNDCNDTVPLIGYADSDWARDKDRKSTSGYLFKVFNNVVIWRSKKQATVALSTTEAELISLCESVVEACWIVKLLNDLNVECPKVTMFEDNISTINSVKNPDQKRLKHMDIKYNFVKQKIEEGLINVMYVNTKYQLADALTKPLAKIQFSQFMFALGMRCALRESVE